jgi:hypothetical protein
MNQGEHSLILNANSAGTLPVYTRYVSHSRGNDATGDGSLDAPFATIAKASHSIAAATGNNNLNGGEILLEAGSYVYYVDRSMAEPNRATARLVTLRPAAGVAKADVRVTGTTHPGLWRNFVKIQGLTIDRTSILGNGGFIWFDDVEFIGQGFDVGMTNVSNGSYPQFWTSSHIHDTQVALRMVTIARGMLLENMGEDAFKSVDLIINSEVKNIQLPSGSPWHPDVWQYYGISATAPIENLIVYGLIAVEGIHSQGVGPTHVRDVAFVNVNVDNAVPNTTAQNYQVWGLHHHVYVKNSRLIGRNLWRESTSLPLDTKSVVLENSFFDWALPERPGVMIRSGGPG